MSAPPGLPILLVLTRHSKKRPKSRAPQLDDLELSSKETTYSRLVNAAKGEDERAGRIPMQIRAPRISAFIRISVVSFFASH
jgi:hypothetical protein